LHPAGAKLQISGARLDRKSGGMGHPLSRGTTKPSGCRGGKVWALSALSLRTGDFRLSDWGPGTMQSSCFEASVSSVFR
jgi:hypothetical protein